MDYNGNNYIGFLKYINAVGKTHLLFQIHMDQVKEKNVGIDNVTKIYGKKPTLKQILEMIKYKGITIVVRVPLQ